MYRWFIHAAQSLWKHFIAAPFCSSVVDALCFFKRAERWFIWMIYKRIHHVWERSETVKWGLAKFIAKLKSPVSMGKDSIRLSELLFTWSIKGIYKEAVKKNLAPVVCILRSAKLSHKREMLPHTAQLLHILEARSHLCLYRHIFWLVTTLLFFIQFYMMAKVTLYTFITLKFNWMNKKIIP